jgi:DUF4097 and DUF4098 domain-containing protein YvlB
LKISNINGNVKISSWSYDKVSLNAVSSTFLSNDELDKIEIVVTESENIIDIQTKKLMDGTTNVTTEMTIKAPYNITADTIDTSNGDIDIAGIKGNISATSSNGDIVIQDVRGYIQADTSNGDIVIKKTTGLRNLHSSNGMIDAEMYDFKENVTIDTSNGDIYLYLNPSLNADLEMTTSNGIIIINELSVNLTISENDYKVGMLGDGENKINIQTSNGDIFINKLEM